MSCDATQKGFEQCMCEKNRCHDTVCNIEYENCYADCSAKYEAHVHEKQCLEKDRKIDWSATKKIECYVDILLHDYTKEELLSKCGSETCINEAREADYKSATPSASRLTTTVFGQALSAQNWPLWSMATSSAKK